MVLAKNGMGITLSELCAMHPREVDAVIAENNRIVDAQHPGESIDG